MNGYLEVKPVIKGKLQAQFQTIHGKISAGKTIKCKISIPTSSTHEVYDGPYDVDPKSRDILLETNGKLLKQDITVKKISLYEVSNKSGTTIYIGGI